VDVAAQNGAAVIGFGDQVQAVVHKAGDGAVIGDAVQAVFGVAAKRMIKYASFRETLRATCHPRIPNTPESNADYS
jgi:hypothetical protein